MTNHECLQNITGEHEPVEIVALKMLLAKIEDDVSTDLYNYNKDKYIHLYRSQKEWLNEEKGLEMDRELKPCANAECPFQDGKCAINGCGGYGE